VVFDGYVARSLVLQDTWRPVAVKGDLGVGVVAHQQQVVLAAELDRVLPVFVRRDAAGRVVGIIQVQDLGAPELIRRHFGPIEQEPLLPAQRDLSDVSAQHVCAAEVRVVPWIWHDRHVTRIDVEQWQVRDPLLGADEGQDLVKGVDPDIEPFPHPFRDLQPELGQAALERITAHSLFGDRLLDRRDRLRRRHLVGIACTQVDDIDPLLDQLGLDLRDIGQRVRRQRRELFRVLWNLPVHSYR
jgi:hypothetical protein